MRLETVCTRYGLDTELTPTSLVQNMHLQVLRIIFSLEAVFSPSQPAVHVNKLKNMRAFCRSRDWIQNIAHGIWCSLDCMKNQLGLHILLQGLICQASRFLHASANNLHMILAGHRAYSHVIGAEPALSSPPNLFFSLKLSFHCHNTPPAMWTNWKTWGHSAGHETEYNTLLTETGVLWTAWGIHWGLWMFMKAVFWDRNRNRCEMFWTPSTLLYTFMPPELP